LFAFLLFWLRSLSPEFSENTATRLFSTILIIAVPVALLVGRWSDRNARPLYPLAILAGLSSIGLLVMALAGGLTGALVGYLLFGVTSMTFLSLHSSQTLRVLARPQFRGRDLGVFNLTNTVPSLIIPGLTIALVPSFGFSSLFLLLAILAFVACLLIAVISRRN
jgi:sugar phosphate permease